MNADSPATDRFPRRTGPPGATVYPVPGPPAHAPFTRRASGAARRGLCALAGILALLGSGPVLLGSGLALLGSGRALAQTGAVPGVSLANITCPDTPVGTTSVCKASQTLTANGQVTMTVSPYLADTGVVAMDLGTCVAPKVFQDHDTCVTGAITFTPLVPGPYVTYLLLPDGAGPGSTLTEKISGNGTSATPVLTPMAVTCPATLVGATSTCSTGLTLTASGGALTVTGAPVGLDPADFTLDPGGCAAGTAVPANDHCRTGPLTFHPTTLGALSDLVTITTSSLTTPSLALTVQGRATSAVWVGSGYSACSGGTGLWSEGDWAPTTGCGTYTQTRTVSCVPDPDSGTQTQAVTCQGPNGATLPDSACQAAAGAPPTTRHCTPTVGTGTGLCGSQPATTQVASGTSGCAYRWQAGPFGRCQGTAGSANWTLGSWGPPVGCGAVTQTRTATCAFTPGSGQEARTVTCQASDGTVVADSHCSGAKPATGQACTPTDATLCGSSPATQQIVDLTNGCGNGVSPPACLITPESPYCVQVPLDHASP